MILSDDVVLPNGTTILTKNSVLQVADINNLQRFNVEKVNVYDLYANITSSTPTENIVKLSIVDENNKPVRERESFKEFSKSYETKVEEMKGNFLAIGQGEAIQESRLLNSTQEMLDKVYIKNDIINFIHHLKESDDHTYHHCVNVSLLCNLVGTWAGFNETELKNVTLAGLLHDIGKTYIDQDVLNKPGRLTDEEYEEIKKHPLYGYKVLVPQNIATEVKLAVLMHHEKIDGTGYPLGADISKIGKISKIVTICDIYDAMTSNRCYHKKRCPFDVIKMFEDDCFGKLDTEYLMLFLKNIANTFLNNEVVLSDEQRGKIVFINSKEPSKP
ncbi:MAG: HD-GYP domain-containing protein, partial [Firmicutes bacterium]|nr:HD-GYP domain-containing protein [Bacillota bacterium]